jgi:hypothetical protein
MVFAALALACNKSINAASNKSYLAATNLSPDAPPLDIVFEGNDTLNESGPLHYDSTTGVPGNPYLTAVAGIHSLAIIGNGHTYVNGNVGLLNKYYYSLFIYDSASNGELGTLILQDVLNPIPDTSSSLRFLNFSSNTPSLYIQMTNAVDTVNFGNIPFPYVGNNHDPSDLSRTTLIRPGTYHILAAMDTTAVFDLDSLTFYGGKIYTVFTKGLLSATSINSPGLIQHN